MRLPQTERIIFGGVSASVPWSRYTNAIPTGCHDNGYVTALRSHITSGYKQKLMLLQSYDEIATGIRDLDLPVLMIPGLFMAGNLDTLQTPALAPVELPLGVAATVPIGPVPSTPRRRGFSLAQSERSDSAAGQIALSPAPVFQALRPIDRSVVCSHCIVQSTCRGSLEYSQPLSARTYAPMTRTALELTSFILTQFDRPLVCSIIYHLRSANSIHAFFIISTILHQQTLKYWGGWPRACPAQLLPKVCMRLHRC